MNLQLPNKSHFKLNEVCSLTGVKPYVLRFWESEFPEIKALTSSSGQKLYDHEDIEIISMVKHLLFDKKMTVEEAKAEFKLNASQFKNNQFEFVPELPPIVDESMESEEMELSYVAESNPTNIKTDELLAAKERLRDLLSLTNAVKERHNWN